MFNTIIVPTDFSDEASTVESLIKAKSISNNDRVILLHVLEHIPTFALAEIPSDLVDKITPKTYEKMQRMAEKADVDAKIEVATGNSYREIIKSAINNKAGLILINSHQPGVQSYLLGSTAAKVVRHAPCSVLVVR